MTRDRTWNREVRQGETEAERADRNVRPAPGAGVVFRRHLKDELLQLAGILTLAGPSLFGLALTAAGASTGRGD